MVLTKEDDYIPVKPKRKACKIFHIPYGSQLLKKKNCAKCLECDEEYVPNTLFVSLDLFPGIDIIGKPMMVEARISRPIRKEKGESRCISISEQLIFLEYDLHSQLIWKLRLYSKNCIFSLKTQAILGESSLVGIATGMAVLCKALPMPMPLIVKRNNSSNVCAFDEKDSKISEISKYYAEMSLNKSILKILPFTQFKTAKLEPNIIKQSNSSHSTPSKTNLSPLFKGTTKNLDIDDKLEEENLRASIIRHESLDKGMTTSDIINYYNNNANFRSYDKKQIVCNISSNITEKDNSSNYSSEEDSMDGSEDEFRIEGDDDKDQYLLNSVLNPIAPSDVIMCAGDSYPGVYFCPDSTISTCRSIKNIVKLDEVALTGDMIKQSNQLRKSFNDLYANLIFALQVQNFTPCVVCGLKFSIYPVGNSITRKLHILYHDEWLRHQDQQQV